MKKLGSFLLITIVAFTLFACREEKLKIAETRVISPIGGKEEKSLQSFGNQQNHQLMKDREFIQDEGWIYCVDKYFSDDEDSEERTIVRFPLDNPEKEEIIYKGVCLEQISVLGDWIFFLEDVWEGNLFKIKKDGSEKTKLASKVDVYILTEEKVYYGTNYEELKICVMELDGSNKRDVLGSGHGLVGIDHGWIYFNKYDEYCTIKEPGPYRIKLDGTGKESLLDPNLEVWSLFTVEEDQLFFSRWDKNGASLIRKVIGEKKETILGIFFPYKSVIGVHSPPSLPVNKEGDWLYICENKSVYRINEKKKMKKEFLYMTSLPITGILVYDGDVLLATEEKGAVYLKKDGTVIDIGIQIERVLRSTQN